MHTFLYLNNLYSTSRRVMPNDKDDFNLLHGIIKVDDKYQVIQRAWIYFEHFDAQYDMIVDNYSITKMEPACTGNLVRNSDFEIGDSRFWINYGTTSWTVIDDVPGATKGKALKVYDRGGSDYGRDWGIYSDLYIDLDCLNENDRFKVFVRYQVQDSNGNVIRCDRTTDNTLEECAYMRAKTYSDDYGDPHPYIASPAAVSDDIEDPDWAWLTGIFTLGAAEANHYRMYLNIAGPHKDNSIIVDEVKMEPLPMNCNQLVENPNFTGSTSYWKVNTHLTEISIHMRGNNPTALLKHDHHWHIMEQKLDTRCIIEGQSYKLYAKFQLLNATDLSQSLSCRSDERR